MGIKDITYASLFDKKDLPYLYRLVEEVRATHNQDLVNDFNNTLKKKWNDHNAYLQVSNKDIEILQVSKADDLVVTAGINFLIDQILGSTVVRWRYIWVGTGTTAPALAQTALTTPLFIVDMSLYGWREYAGSTLRFAGLFLETAATHTATEVGVFDNSGAVMLNRNMFSSNPIAHVVNQTGYVISSVVEFVPVM